MRSKNMYKDAWADALTGNYQIPVRADHWLQCFRSGIHMNLEKETPVAAEVILVALEVLDAL